MHTEQQQAWHTLLALLSPYNTVPPKEINDVAVVQLANQHNVLFSLIERLQHKQQLGLFEPLSQEYFAELYAQQRARQALALEQIAHINQALNAAGIVPCYIKGTAALLQGWHGIDVKGEASAGRFFNDIDILLSPADAVRAQALLEAMNYQPCAVASPVRHHHLQSLQHSDWPLAVEVHCQPLSARAGFVLPADELLQRAQSFSDAAMGPYLLPSLEDSLCLLVNSAELAHWGAYSGAIKVKDALDAIALQALLAEAELEPAAVRAEACAAGLAGPHSSDLQQAYLYSVLQVFSATDALLESLASPAAFKRFKRYQHWQAFGVNTRGLLVFKLRQRFSSGYLQRKYGCGALILRPDVIAKELWHVLALLRP